MSSSNIEKNTIKRTIVYVMVFLAVFHGPMPVLFAAIDDVPGMIQNGNVVHGVADGGVTGANTVTITTGGAKTIINYDQFNINTGWTVNFQQPNANAATLNRVVVANPSQIDGTLQSNGKIFLINPAGVMFGSGAVVNVTQLVASALDMSNSDFLADKMLFSGTSGSVENQGAINADMVSLIGKGVTNTGQITCPNGYVILAAGDTVYLKPQSSGILVEVGTIAPGSQGIVMNNTGGNLNAEGADGTVILAAAGDALSVAVSNTGNIKAGKAQIQAAQSEISNCTIDVADMEIAGDASIENTSITGNVSADKLTFQGTVNANGSGNQVFEATQDWLTADILNKSDTGNLTLKGSDGIDLNGDVTVGDGDLNIADNTTVAANTILKASDNITIGTGKTVSGDTALTLEATGGSISGGTIEVSGSSLTLIQSADIDLSTMTFSNQANTELSLNSTNGSVIADTGDNAADQWSSIIAKADGGDIVFTGSDSGTIKIAPNGSSVTQLEASGNNSVTDTDGINFANTDVSGTEINLDGPVTWVDNIALTLNAGTDITLEGSMNGIGVSSELAFNFGMSGTGGTLDLSGASSLTAGTITATGGLGTDIIIGRNFASTWTLNVTPTYSDGTATIALSGIETLRGGSDTDNFTLAGGTLSGTIAGGLGDNSLTGDNVANAWTITGANSGTVTGVTGGFTQIANLTGGSDADTFTLENAGTLSGSVVGGGQAGDKLDLSAKTGAVSINQETTQATDIAGTFSGIGAVVGNGVSTTITGANAGEAFSITGADAGTAGTLAFTGVGNLTGGSGTDTFTLAGGTLSGTIAGGLGDNSLTGDNVANAWTITGANSGTVTGVTGGFTQIANLTGGSGTDTFTLAGGTLSGTIAGGLGDNSLTGDNVANAWTITGANSGTVTGVTGGFTQIANLTGGSDADTFTLENAGTLSGSVVGGGQAGDKLDLSAKTGAVSINQETTQATDIAGTFSGIGAVVGNGVSTTITGANAGEAFSITGADAGTAGTLAFTGVGNLTGGSGTDNFTLAGGTLSGTIAGGLGDNSLTGDNVANAWTITGANSGTVTGVTGGFTQIANLTGGSDADTFTLENAGTLSGSVVGGGQAGDKLDLSAKTGAVSINQETTQATDIAGTFSGIGAVVGNGVSTTITGANAGEAFSITGADAGTAGTLAFTGVGNLTGGSGTDTFTLAGGTLSGTIAGGLGDNSLTGDNVANAWTITGANSGTVTGVTGGFTQIANLTGGSGTDTFTLAGGTLSGTIAGGLGDNSLTGDNVANAWTITGANSGTVTGVTGGFTQIANLTGGSDADTFTLENAGTLSGSVVGGGQAGDKLDLSAKTGAVSINQETTQATDIAGTFSGIGAVVGNGVSTTITGANAGEAFSITGADAGTAGTLAFTGVGNLTGGSGTDTFTLENAGTLSGNLTGGSGADTFTGEVGSSINGALTDATGTSILNGTIMAGSVNLTGNVELGADTTLTGNEVIFGGKVDSADDTAKKSLKVNSAGLTKFSGTVGGNAALASLTTDNQSGLGEKTELHGNVTTSGNQTYNDAVTLAANATLTGNAVTFGSTVNGSYDLMINASDQTTFGGVIGETGKELSSMTINAKQAELNSAVNTLNNIEITTENDIQVGGAVTSTGGGVKLVSENGSIFTDDSATGLNVAIAGSSNDAGDIGVDLPGGSEKAAIVIISKNKDLKLGTGAELTANGSYNPSPDDRSSILFYSEDPQGLDQKAGVACDVAIYLASYFYDTISKSQTGGNLTINSASISCSSLNATVVLDAMDTVSEFGDALKGYLMANGQDFRIEAVSRISDSEQTAMFYHRLPYLGMETLPWGPSIGDFVYRGMNNETNPDAQVLAAVLGFINAPVVPPALRPLEFKAETKAVDIEEVKRWAKINLDPLLSGQSDQQVYVSATDFTPLKTLIDLYEHYQIMVKYKAPSKALERMLPDNISDTEATITMNWLTGQIAPMASENDRKMTVAWINSIASSYVTFITSTELKATDDLVKYYLAMNLKPLLDDPGREFPKTAFVIDQWIGGLSTNTVGPVGMN